MVSEFSLQYTPLLTRKLGSSRIVEACRGLPSECESPPIRRLWDGFVLTRDST